jgi:hypothetical protein
MGFFSDATNLQTKLVQLDDNHYQISGRKWWSTVRDVALVGRLETAHAICPYLTKGGHGSTLRCIFGRRQDGASAKSTRVAHDRLGATSSAWSGVGTGVDGVWLRRCSARTRPSTIGQCRGTKNKHYKRRRHGLYDFASSFGPRTDPSLHASDWHGCVFVERMFVVRLLQETALTGDSLFFLSL